MTYYAPPSKRRRTMAVRRRRPYRMSRRPARSAFRTKRSYYKPYRRYHKKRVAIRRPTAPAMPSPFKSSKELLLSNLWGNAGPSPLDRSSIPTVDARWVAAFYLSPQQAGTSGDRKVEGDRARLLSANLQYIFANELDANLTVRMTVVEMKALMEPISGSTINFTNNIHLNRLFKNEAPSAGINDYKTFLNASGRERDLYAINTAEYKVLGQKIIKLGPSDPTPTDWTNRPSVQGVHMYVKMNRMLDEDKIMTSTENSSRGAFSDPATTNYTRYAYYKPIIVLVEVIPEVGRTAGSEVKLVEIERNVKYTWNDSN